MQISPNYFEHHQSTKIEKSHKNLLTAKAFIETNNIFAIGRKEKISHFIARVQSSRDTPWNRYVATISLNNEAKKEKQALFQIILN